MPRRKAGSKLPTLFLGAKLVGLLVLLVVYVTGCDEQPSRERAATAKREAEAQLMARSATAAPEIERRLGQWLTARDGLLYVHESPDVHVLPAGAPWQASCGETGLTMIVGGFWKDVTDIALDERQCNELLSVLGQAMLRLTATDRPAPQPKEEK